MSTTAHSEIRKARPAKARPSTWRWVAWPLLCAAVVFNVAAQADGAPAERAVQNAPNRATAQPPAVQRSEHAYQLPPVNLLDGTGRARRLGSILDDGRPVVLTFMYSSCTTVCPVTSHVMTEFVRLLGAEAPKVNVVSVSIDPDYDTVARLAAHAQQAGLAGGFYTGDPGASQTVQRAFDAWRGDKMNHEPVIFLRGNARSTWVRLDGLVSPQRLVTEYRQLAKPT